MVPITGRLQAAFQMLPAMIFKIQRKYQLLVTNSFDKNPEQSSYEWIGILELLLVHDFGDRHNGGAALYFRRRHTRLIINQRHFAENTADTDGREFLFSPIDYS